MSGVEDGARLYGASRGRGEAAPAAERVQRGVGRGEVLAQAQRGDREAREALRRHRAGTSDDTDPDVDEQPLDYGGGTRTGAGSPARARYSASGSTDDGAELFKKRGAGYDA